MTQAEGFTIRPLERGETEAAGMTFAAYHHLLPLEPTERHPGDGKLIQPVGVVAFHEERMVGLALAEIPLSPGAFPEILSLFVRPQNRNQGVATALVASLETHLALRGCPRLEAVYMTGKPSVPAVERVFVKRGWDPPVPRTITVKFTPEEAATTAWYGRIPLRQNESIFPWRELTPAEREEIQASNARAPWIAPGLEAWRHDSIGFDPVSSMGLRYRGQVVGWVINHRIAPDTVRLTCSFVRADLARRARILPLYTASLERLRATGCHNCIFVTPVSYGPMVEFVKTRCEQWVSFVGETRGVAKQLGGASEPS
jgi:GNAT superfamily N-acetyltransferase